MPHSLRLVQLRLTEPGGHPARENEQVRTGIRAKLLTQWAWATHPLQNTVNNCLRTKVVITGCELMLWNCRVRGGTLPKKTSPVDQKQGIGIWESPVQTLHPDRSFWSLIDRESDSHWSSQVLQNLPPQPALPNLQSMMNNTESRLQTLAPSCTGWLSMVPEVQASCVLLQCLHFSLCVHFSSNVCASFLNQASASMSPWSSLMDWGCNENFPLQLVSCHFLKT